MELITLEEGDIGGLRKEIWTRTTKDCEEQGNCLSNMAVVEQLEAMTGSSQIYSYRYRLKRQLTSNGTATTSILKTNIAPGDAIVVSSEQKPQYALAIGFVVDANDDAIVITTDRALRGLPERLSDFDNLRNQDHAGLVHYHRRPKLSFVTKIEPSIPVQPHSVNSEFLYRIDREEMMGGMGTARFNMLHLFTAHGDAKRRKLIVDLTEPEFHKSWDDTVEKKNSGLVEAALADPRLNEDQRSAIEKVLTGA